MSAATIALGRINDDGSPARATVSLASSAQSPVAVATGTDGTLLMLTKDDDDALRGYSVGPTAVAPATTGVLAAGPVGEAAVSCRTPGRSCCARRTTRRPSGSVWPSAPPAWPRRW